MRDILTFILAMFNEALNETVYGANCLVVGAVTKRRHLCWSKSTKGASTSYHKYKAAEQKPRLTATVWRLITVWLDDMACQSEAFSLPELMTFLQRFHLP